MVDISALIREKNRYIELRSNVSSLANQIGRCIDSLEPTISKMNEYYTIDNVAYDFGSLKKNCAELISKQVSLNSEVLPAINSEISRVDSEIQVAEEELERERKEAEEKAAAAQKEAEAKATTLKQSQSNVQIRRPVSKINKKINLLK